MAYIRYLRIASISIVEKHPIIPLYTFIAISNEVIWGSIEIYFRVREEDGMPLLYFISQLS